MKTFQPIDTENEKFFNNYKRGKTFKKEAKMKITIKELREMIKEAINEQQILPSFGDPWGLRNLFRGDKTVYLQVNNLPRGAAQNVIPFIRQGLNAQQESLVAELLNVVHTTMSGISLVPGAELIDSLSKQVMEHLTQSTIQWGGSGDNPYGVVVVTLRGGENTSDQWLENFRRRSENLLKTNISPNISLRLTQRR